MNQSPPLLDEVTCPNCWVRFPAEAIRYIATHATLFGDRRLGPDAQQRFLPSRFDPDGQAIDPRGGLCHELACPHCHLPVPRPLLESPTLFASILGSPASGKSYLMATMLHQLRRVLPRHFNVNFSDADPQANAALHGDERILFDESAGGAVALAKTDVAGDRYRKVDFDGSPLLYPQPYFFLVSPVSGHPLARSPGSVTRTLCLYDNAGESFEPGEDRPSNPATQHLARSNCLLYLFDPLQDPAFRQALTARGVVLPASADAVSYRQDVMLAEAARRVRRFHSLVASARHDCPLFIVVTKFDLWQDLAGGRRLPDPWQANPDGGSGRLRQPVLEKVSNATRGLLLEHAPAIIATAESFIEPSLIRYVPVSSTGLAPTVADDGRLVFRAGSLCPMWAEVPLLWALSRTVPDLIESS